MVTITKLDNNFIFEVKGAHKVWAFRSQITVPADRIVCVQPNLDAVSNWKGFRLPGTYIPYVITAGTYYKNGQKTFWDVANRKKTIVVELKNAAFSQLIIEVDNPEAALALLAQ